VSLKSDAGVNTAVCSRSSVQRGRWERRSPRGGTWGRKPGRLQPQRLRTTLLGDAPMINSHSHSGRAVL